MAFTLRTRAPSLARFFLWGATLCVVALSSNSSHGADGVSAYAPPPPLSLEAAPAPELAPPEYPRRPFELAPELSVALPSCGDGDAEDSRCARLGPGAGFGLTALWRPTPFIALGGSANRWSFEMRAGDARRDAGASRTFYGLLGRLYFDDRGTVEPYFELGLGLGTAASRYGRAGGGVEFFLGRHARLGPAFDWTAIRTSAGFAAFSLRLSLLFGPGS